MKIKVDCFSLKSTWELLRAIWPQYSSQWRGEDHVLLCVSGWFRAGVYNALLQDKSTSHGPTFLMLSENWGPAHQDCKS